MLKKIALGILGLAVTLPALCFAQPPDSGPGHRGGPWGGRHRRADVEARVRTMKIWKMTEELNLSEDQAAKFFPMQNQMENKMDEIDQDRQIKMMELDNEVWKEKPDGKKINDLMEKLETLEKSMLDLRLKFRQDVRGVLTPEQMGKMVLFHQRFPDMMRDAIQDYERRQDSGSPPPPPGMDKGP